MIKLYSNASAKVIFFVILIIGSTACKKEFLNVTDTSTIIRQEYVTDLSTLSDYMNGIYIPFSTDYTFGYNIIYGDLVADNVKPVTGSNAFSLHYNWAQLADDKTGLTPVATSGNMNALWTSGYRIARFCNFVLEKVDQYRNEDPKLADNIKGQALGLRALVYHHLLNVFAQPFQFTGDASHPGIPFITTSDWTQPIEERQSVGEVYADIISDLNSAMQLLPSVAKSTSLMNRNAAKALLARIYLFKRDFTAAKNMAREVMAVVPLMTSNYPGNLFKPQETETLFQLPTRAPAGSSWPSFYFRSASPQFIATTDISKLLTENPNDVRKAWVTPLGTNFKIVKFPANVVSNISSAEKSYYLSIIRSSEMYLTAAESYAQIGNEDSARYYLDVIRKRADPSALTSTAMGTALLDSIYKERRKELAFEGFRLFDLLRTGKGVNRTDASDPIKTLPYPSNKAISPIPFLDIKVSGLEQNIDY